MLIIVPLSNLEPEFRDGHWLLNRLERLHIDYAANAVLGSIDDKEVVVFKFSNYGWINDNRKNTYTLSSGTAGIFINITLTNN